MQTTMMIATFEKNNSIKKEKKNKTQYKTTLQCNEIQSNNNKTQNVHDDNNQIKCLKNCFVYRVFAGVLTLL